MKNLIGLLALCIISASAFAQKLNSKEVPAAVKASLEKSTGVKNAKWDKEGTDYEASFKKTGKETSMVFDEAGTLKETEVEIAKEDLPGEVKSTLKKDFADYKLEEAAQITANGVITYEAEVEKGEQSFELILDAQGNILKKTEEKENSDRKD